MCKIPIYRDGITSSKCIGYIDIKEFIEQNRSPDKDQKDILSAIQKASMSGDKELKVSLKETLKFFTPAVVIPIGETRRYDNIESFNGLAQLDFDNLEKETAIEFKEFLFENYSQIYCAYLSPSKKGVKALIKIPIVKTVTEFQDYYRGIEKEFEIYDGFDSSPKNAVLPLFLSDDVFIRYRENPTVWDIKEEKDVDLREQYPMPQKPYKKTKSNDRNRDRAINTLRKRINSIVDSPGHYQLRSACIVFGTRVGAGYVPYYEAETEIENLVRSNLYLSKGVENYLKTAFWSYKEGLKTPKSYN